MHSEKQHVIFASMIEAPCLRNAHEPENVVVCVELLLDVAVSSHRCRQVDLNHVSLLVLVLELLTAGNLSILLHLILEGDHGRSDGRAVVGADGALPGGDPDVPAGHLLLEEKHVLRKNLFHVGGGPHCRPLEHHPVGIPLAAADGIDVDVSGVLQVIDILDRRQLVQLDVRFVGLLVCADLLPDLLSPPSKALAVLVAVIRRGAPPGLHFGPSSRPRHQRRLLLHQWAA
mmetsp:Transcript_56212/g.116148  ORF Transcript_56212/g.116148 Transcript_56212/m.116148 type:complete len:230 (-) Transcript_56212:207-896(-)